MTAHTQTCAHRQSKIEGQIYDLRFSNIEAVYCSDYPKVLLIKDQDFFEQNGVEFPSLMPGDKEWMEYNKHLLPATIVAGLPIPEPAGAFLSAVCFVLEEL